MHVIRVEFDSKDGIPANVREEISTELRSHVFEREANTAYLNDLADEIAEVGVGGALQNRGFFRARAVAKLTALRSDGADIPVAITISATPGTQYRTRNVRFESADSDFPLGIGAEVLRGLIPLREGELFNVERVRTGMENLTLAYGREGYVDMVPEPKFKIDEGHQIIDLVFRIDQGTQYRVGSIEFLGVNSVTREKLMESLSKSGDIFDAARLEVFFKVNRATLPSDASRDDVKITRDVRTKTVALLFDFRTCPRDSN